MIQIDHSNNGGQSFVGNIVGHPLSEAVFTWRDDIAAGTINLGDSIYRLRHLKDGVHIFEQLPAQYLPSGEPLIPTGLELESHSEHSTEIEIDDASQTNSTTMIDVLVLYTQSSEQAMGGEIGTQNTIDLALTESNLGLQNSGVNVRFNIVHSQKVDFDETKEDFSSMLDELTSTNDGTLDEAHAMRDQYGADVVTMIVNRRLLCGKTYQNDGGNPNFDKFAFSILHHSCVTGYYSFAHEIGHNMGSQHNRSNSSQAGAFNYSYGYQDPGNRFRTIMAYNCRTTCLRINHWSNPNVFYENLGPTGHAAHSAIGADNHLSLSQMAPSMAAFRDRVLDANQVVEINFQLEGTAPEQDILIDNGEPLQVYEGHLVYGWNADYSISVPNQNLNKSNSTFVHAIAEEGEKAIWEMLVPNGRYQVRLISGDPKSVTQPSSMVIENEIVQKKPGSEQSDLFEADLAIEVSDGYLSISGPTHETILNLVEITPLFVDNQNITPEEPNPSPIGPYAIFIPVVVR
ncbi:MAG: M12 family metallo-peptidase [Anaerolineae bacterium]